MQRAGKFPQLLREKVMNDMKAGVKRVITTKLCRNATQGGKMAQPRLNNFKYLFLGSGHVLVCKPSLGRFKQNKNIFELLFSDKLSIIQILLKKF